MSLKTWAQKRTDNPVEAKLASMREGDKPGTLVQPFGNIGREKYKAIIKGQNIPKRVDSAPIKEVELKDLTGIQKTINAERLQQHLENPSLIPKGTRGPGHGMLIDKPVIVKKNGKMMIHDSHHRLTAMKLKGATTAKVRLVDLDANPTPPQGKAGQP